MVEANSVKVAIYVPPRGGRSSYADMLTVAFEELGCEANELMHSAIVETVEGSTADEASKDDLLLKLRRDFDEFSPDVVLDLNPLPPEFHLYAREQGAKTVFWLLEDGYEEEYRYWKAMVDVCDLFVSYQGRPFTPREAEYVPWGADPRLRSLRDVTHRELVLHGSFSANRAECAEFIYEEFAGEIPVKVIGPNWSEWEHFEEFNQHEQFTVKSRWTKPPETARLLRGRIVLAPWRVNRHNAVLPRYWFSLGAGGCLVCDRVEDFSRHVEPGRDCLMFESKDELQEHLVDLINSPEKIERIKNNGRKTVLENHTLTHRARSILEKLGISPPESPNYLSGSS